MRILVIDDAPWNQQSAHDLLGEKHELVVCGTVGEAFELLQNIRNRKYTKAAMFDAVLTDLWLPSPKEVGGAYTEGLYSHDTYVGELIPAGLTFALAAVTYDIPYVAICSDANHHEDRMCALLDLIKESTRADDERDRYVPVAQRVFYFEARYYDLAYTERSCRYYDTVKGAVVTVPRDEIEPRRRELRSVKNWAFILDDVVKAHEYALGEHET